MTIYEYRCPEEHLTHKQLPIGTAPETVPCGRRFSDAEIAEAPAGTLAATGFGCPHRAQRVFSLFGAKYKGGDGEDWKAHSNKVEEDQQRTAAIEGGIPEEALGLQGSRWI